VSVEKLPALSRISAVSVPCFDASRFGPLVLAVLPARRYASAGRGHGAVSVSVTSRRSIERDERVNLVFGMTASFDQSYTVF